MSRTVADVVVGSFGKRAPTLIEAGVSLGSRPGRIDETCGSYGRERFNTLEKRRDESLSGERGGLVRYGGNRQNRLCREGRRGVRKRESTN